LNKIKEKPDEKERKRVRNKGKELDLEVSKIKRE
jgi:hypothetical protein